MSKKNTKLNVRVGKQEEAQSGRIVVRPYREETENRMKTDENGNKKNIQRTLSARVCVFVDVLLELVSCLRLLLLLLC